MNSAVSSSVEIFTECQSNLLNGSIEHGCTILVADILFVHRKSNDDQLLPFRNASLRDEGPAFCNLLQIICTTLLLNNIKHGLGTKPAGYWRSNSLICECCIFVIYFHGFMTSASSSGICHQLRVTAFLKAHEPEHCSFNCSADRQEAVILKKSGLFVRQGVCNFFSFFFGEDYAVEC